MLTLTSRVMWCRKDVMCVRVRGNSDVCFGMEVSIRYCTRWDRDMCVVRVGGEIRPNSPSLD